MNQKETNEINPTDNNKNESICLNDIKLNLRS